MLHFVGNIMHMLFSFMVYYIFKKSLGGSLMAQWVKDPVLLLLWLRSLLWQSNSVLYSIA